MRFYQRIGFRIIACAVLIVTAVAIVLTWYIEKRSKEALRERESAALFDETNLRFREVSAEIQTLREDAVGLVDVPPLRKMQWGEQFRRGESPYPPPLNG